MDPDAHGLSDISSDDEALIAEPSRADEPAKTAGTPSPTNARKSADNIAETAQNQAKNAKLTSVKLAKKIDERLAVIQSQLAEKERLQLTYVYSKVPKPYYWRWKSEGNEVFSLIVGLKRRRSKLGRNA